MDSHLIQRPAPPVAGANISGLTGNGQTLTVSLTPLAGTAITWQWFRNGLPITGAIFSTYVQVPADSGALLAVLVNGLYLALVIG